MTFSRVLRILVLFIVVAVAAGGCDPASGIHRTAPCRGTTRAAVFATVLAAVREIPGTTTSEPNRSGIFSVERPARGGGGPGAPAVRTAYVNLSAAGDRIEIAVFEGLRDEEGKRDAIEFLDTLCAAVTASAPGVGAWTTQDYTGKDPWVLLWLWPVVATGVIILFAAKHADGHTERVRAAQAGAKSG